MRKKERKTHNEDNENRDETDQYWNGGEGVFQTPLNINRRHLIPFKSIKIQKFIDF